ncbi:hypothetical protein IFM89_009262 [Coptis chinensis]|uniref:KIB1-4 beta-propeller domain-containing protein n=1 Tax=Coptis chinensis TaxID=261450 RepID=A0A835IB80_9MAGN|nr:hypothetical protein IFM89_009262 [Coptis chinensis]
MVLFVVKKSFLTWQLGDKKWTKQNYELGRTHPDTEEYIDKAISCKDGIIYALTTQSVAVIIDRKSCGTLSVRSLDFPRPRFSETIRLEEELVESRGDIYLVVILYVGHKAIQVAHVEVFKMDLYKKVWVKVESIGHQVFFVAQCGSISLPATNLGLKGNCIYFSISADDLLYVFDLEDGNLSNYLPCPNLATPSFTPFWYLPNNWLVEIQKEDVNTVPKTELKIEMADNKFATVEEPVEESIGFRWINLPMDILRSIAMCLHSSADFVNFGRVCKSFASSIPQSPLTTQYPQLMFSNRTSLCSFCDPMHNVTYCFDMPDLLGARIRFSKDGWCLMSKGDYSMFFFNPFTKVTVTLPDLPPKHSPNDGFSFTQVPTSPDCIVFGIAGIHEFFVQILYLHLGEDAWTQEYGENEVEFFPSNNNLVFHDGAFYCLGAERYLGVFDLRDDKWTILLTPEPCSSTQKNYLVESDGEILSVFVGREGNIRKDAKQDLFSDVVR